jgi:hypothetical protein
MALSLAAEISRVIAVCRIVRMAPAMSCIIAVPVLLSYPTLLLRAYAEAGLR